MMRVTVLENSNFHDSNCFYKLKNHIIPFFLLRIQVYSAMMYRRRKFQVKHKNHVTQCYSNRYGRTRVSNRRRTCFEENRLRHERSSREDTEPRKRLHNTRAIGRTLPRIGRPPPSAASRRSRVPSSRPSPPTHLLPTPLDHLPTASSPAYSRRATPRPKCASPTTPPLPSANHPFARLNRVHVVRLVRWSACIFTPQPWHTYIPTAVVRRHQHTFRITNINR